nr:MAG TPA: hypothetical protein [Caudoviricetes sp.]
MLSPKFPNELVASWESNNSRLETSSQRPFLADKQRRCHTTPQ